jgi:hypothetical protein
MTMAGILKRTAEQLTQKTKNNPIAVTPNQEQFLKRPKEAGTHGGFLLTLKLVVDINQFSANIWVVGRLAIGGA